MKTLASILAKVDSIKLYRALDDRLYYAEYRIKAGEPLEYSSNKSLDDLFTVIDLRLHLWPEPFFNVKR